MVKSEAHTQELLRERNVAKRRLQVWVALTAIWAIVLGWVAWGLAGMAAGDNDAVAWCIYALPLAALAIGTLAAWARVRRVDAALVHVASS